MADLNVTLGNKYPVLVGGAPATADDTFAAASGGIIDIHEDDDGTFKLFTVSAGETDLDDSHPGEVVNTAHVIVASAPVDITLGAPEPE